MQQEYDGEWFMPESIVASNVYCRAKALYRPDSRPVETSLFRNFIAVRGGGIENEMQTPEFMSFAAYVSNHCAEIVADWPAYETNEVVRWTTISAVGFSGYENMTNLACRVVGDYGADTNSCSWRTVKFLLWPYGTPQHKYATLHYGEPAVSNMLETIKSRASEIGDANIAEACEWMLSGEAKAEYEAMKAAGAL